MMLLRHISFVGLNGLNVVVLMPMTENGLRDQKKFQGNKLHDQLDENTAQITKVLSMNQLLLDVYMGWKKFKRRENGYHRN